MKRYLLFCYDRYDRGGGWLDFVDSFNSVEEAMAARQLECYQVVDSMSGTLEVEGEVSRPDAGS